MIKNAITKLSKEPLVYFFVLGFVVFGLHSFLNRADRSEEDRFTVDVTSTDIEWIRSSWQARMKRPPTPQELHGLIDRFIRDKILHREALAMDLDDRDLVVQRRLVQKLTFVLEDLAETIEPTDEELKTYLEKKQERYQIPATISFTQLYFSPNKRPKASDDAKGALDQIKTKKLSSGEAASLGDSTLLETSFRQKTPEQVARALGREFAGSLFSLEEHGWHGPIASTFGMHLVHIDDRTPAQMPDFSLIREEVKADFMYGRKKEIVDGAYDAAKSRYTVLVEGLPHE